ncbi:hypothetical protein [Prevotella pallens]|uniref:hypothetical protein n=2 Tax=Prevotellaceae TaxID=171552 RepID=UPI0036F4095A
MRCRPRKGWKYDRRGSWSSFVPVQNISNFAIMEKPIEIDGINAMQWAREISKLPEGDFTLCFFPYSRSQGMAGDTLTVKKHCKYRTQLPQDRFSVDAENYFLFEDEDGNPKMCYRILIRYMGFPNDGYKLHKINWL